MLSEIMKSTNSVTKATDISSEIQNQVVETVQKLFKESVDKKALAQNHLKSNELSVADMLMKEASSQQLKAYDLLEKSGLSEEEQQNIISKINSDEDKEIQREETNNKIESVIKSPREALSNHLKQIDEIANRETQKSLEAMKNTPDSNDYQKNNSTNYIRRYDAVMDAYYEMYPSEKSISSNDKNP